MRLPIVKIGVVQATPVFFNLEKSITKVVDWIAKGRAAGCQLLLFPESFLPDYPRGLRFDAVVGRRTEAGRDGAGIRGRIVVLLAVVLCSQWLAPRRAPKAQTYRAGTLPLGLG